MKVEEKDQPIPKDQQVQGEGQSNKSAFGKLPIEISEEDLSHKGVQRLLLNDLRRLQLEVNRLEEIEEKFHLVDKEKAVLEVKTTKNKFVDYLSKFSIGMGGVILSLGAKTYDFVSTSANNSLSWLLIVAGIVLILGSLIVSSQR